MSKLALHLHIPQYFILTKLARLVKAATGSESQEVFLCKATESIHNTPKQERHSCVNTLKPGLFINHSAEIYMNHLLRCYALYKNKAVCGLFHKNVYR